jgi:hypothetical protein
MFFDGVFEEEKCLSKDYIIEKAILNWTRFINSNLLQ